MEEQRQSYESRAFELLDRIETQCNASGKPVGGLQELRHIIAALTCGDTRASRPEADVERVAEFAAECRDALSAALPYMEGSSFSFMYCKEQVKRQIAACEEAIAAMQNHIPDVTKMVAEAHAVGKREGLEETASYCEHQAALFTGWGDGEGGKDWEAAARVIRALIARQ
jgi:hypothetical protein